MQEPVDPIIKTKEVLQHIAANVRRLRRAKGLTQVAFAEKAGISFGFFQRVERARCNISVGILVRMAMALNEKPQALLEPAKFGVEKPGRPRNLVLPYPK